jgi:NAD(P)-dependent dehydrogenase (short-subunit alcohol dehydrogenase family)
LVNNAGTTKVIPHADLAAASLDVWREIFEVNVFGTWSLCVAAMEALTREPRRHRERLIDGRGSTRPAHRFPTPPRRPLSTT